MVDEAAPALLVTLEVTAAQEPLEIQAGQALQEPHAQRAEPESLVQPATLVGRE